MDVQKKQLVNASFDDLISEKDLLEKWGIEKRTLANKRTGANAILQKGIHWFCFSGCRVYSKEKLLQLLQIPIQD